MKINRVRGLPIIVVSATIACILQVIGLVRYPGRLAEDWVGIGLYSATIVAFALAAFGFFIQWRQQKPKNQARL